MMKRRWMRPLAAGMLGAAGGFAYYYFIGCASGTCPITGNPYIATLYGAFMGLTLGWPGLPKSETKSATGETKQNGEGT